jgi:hypothetical protein
MYRQIDGAGRAKLKGNKACAFREKYTTAKIFIMRVSNNGQY